MMTHAQINELCPPGCDPDWMIAFVDTLCDDPDEIDPAEGVKRRYAERVDLRARLEVEGFQ